MPIQSSVRVSIAGGGLFRRPLRQVLKAEGIKVDWNDHNVLALVENIVDRCESDMAREIKTSARVMVRRKAYDTGALHRSIRAERSKYRHGGWIVKAGNETDIDYAPMVEIGRFYEGKNIANDPKDYTRVERVTYLRTPLHRVRRKFRRVLVGRFKTRFKL